MSDWWVDALSVLALIVGLLATIAASREVYLSRRRSYPEGELLEVTRQGHTSVGPDENRRDLGGENIEEFEGPVGPPSVAHELQQTWRMEAIEKRLQLLEEAERTGILERLDFVDVDRPSTASSDLYIGLSGAVDSFLDLGLWKALEQAPSGLHSGSGGSVVGLCQGWKFRKVPLGEV